MLSNTKGKPIQIVKMSENEAVEIGANMFGEAIILSIASVILIAEYSRQKIKEAAKELEAVETLQSLQNQVAQLQNAVQEMESRILTTQAPQEPAKCVESAVETLWNQVAQLQIAVQEMESRICRCTDAAPAKCVESEPVKASIITAISTVEEQKPEITVTCVAPVPTEPKVITDAATNQERGVLMKAVSHLIKI